MALALYLPSPSSSSSSAQTDCPVKARAVSSFHAFPLPTDLQSCRNALQFRHDTNNNYSNNIKLLFSSNVPFFWGFGKAHAFSKQCSLFYLHSFALSHGSALGHLTGVPSLSAQGRNQRIACGIVFLFLFLRLHKPMCLNLSFEKATCEMQICTPRVRKAPAALRIILLRKIEVTKS